MSRKKSKPSYKSKFEATVAKVLPKGTEYEPITIDFVQPMKKRKYKPDFVLPNGLIIETKGKWTQEDRQKHVWLREQRPDLRICLLFMSAFNRIRKGSKTTYADFCNQHGIEWADFNVGIPKEWLSADK